MTHPDNDMEMSPSWSRAHDWKSCNRQKRFESSNLSISAKEKPAEMRVFPLFMRAFRLFTLCAYCLFFAFFASQWHRKSTGKYRKMPPPVMEGVLLRLGLDEVFIHWVSALGICLCFHTAAICAGCSILISKEVLLRFVYGVLIHINYTFQTASRADHCDPRGFVQEEIMKKM